MSKIFQSVFDKVKSKYCLNIIFSNLNEKRKLNIIKYNKRIQSLLEIGIHKYIFKELYDEINKEKGKNKFIDYYYSICSKFYESITNEKRRNEIIIDLINDLFRLYPKTIYIRFPIDYGTYLLNEFNFLISIKSPIKIILQMLTRFTSYKDDEINRIHFNLLKIIEKHNKRISGFDFDFEDDIDYDTLFPKNVLNNLNKTFENIEYIKISSRFTNYLIDKQCFIFLNNNFKIIEFELNYSQEDDFSALQSFLQIIRNNLKLNELKIIGNDTEAPEGNYFDLDTGDHKDILSLSNISTIKKLELDRIYNFFQFDDIVSKNLSFLYINHTFINYIGDNINFSNLKYLTIKDANLCGVFNAKKVHFDSFTNLEHLTVDIIATVDFVILDKIIESSADRLIEFNIYNFNDLETSYDHDYFEYFMKENGEEEEIEEEKEKETDMDIEYEYEYEEELGKINKKFGEYLLKLKNLKYLRIFKFDIEYNPFIKVLLKEYENENLIEFESDCIELSSAKEFLNRNPNIKKLLLTEN